MEASSYFSVIDKILAHFAGPLFTEETKRAKSEFFDNAGILEEKSEQYELRMSQFFDWYFFTRELTGYGETPLEVAHMARELRFVDEELKVLHDLKKHRHSIFEIVKNKGDDVIVRDLRFGDKLTVKNSDWSSTLSPDLIFEARVLPCGQDWIFTKGFCFHPTDARKFIMEEIKRHKKDPDLDPEVMMLRLVKMRYKFERYKHVKIDMIYSHQSKIGV